ncbi:hypothetical protein FB45DRAFT_920559 [Roridomyces roridus]|uniref:MYND-type domain-containing protein n=1 Tax=Roridomyces roridus TaxID=1738132 RepID=A0AAD7BPL1_9AGAR|nr:hypothetical protein FB45DRAFT_920559 [Roridomyces roridus]
MDGRELGRKVTATPMRYITAARQQSLVGLEALEDLASVWEDILETVELGVVDLFLSHLDEDLAPKPSSPREWQIDADFAYTAISALAYMGKILENPNLALQTEAIFSALPGIIKWSQYVYDMKAEDSPDFIHTLIHLFALCAEFPAWAPVLFDIPGCLQLMTKLWIWDSTAAHTDTTRALAIILAHAKGRVDVYDRIDDAVDGDVGSIARLALRRAKKATKRIDTEEGQIGFTVCVDLISTLCYPPPPHRFREAFFAAGVITTLTRSFVTVSRIIPSNPTQSHEMMFISFVNFFAFSLEGSDYLSVVQAVKAGFLQALIRCSPAFPHMEELLVDRALDIVSNIMPLYTVYYSFMHAIGHFIEEWRDPPYTELLEQPEMAEAFSPFLITADRRVAAMQYWDGGRGPSCRCHNLQCQNLNAQTKLKRCEACRTVYYCSLPCQRLDWKATHRRLCHPFRLQRPSGQRPKRDMDCLRAIAQYTADLDRTVFLFIAERDFPDTPLDELIPWIDFTCVPENLSLKLVKDAVEWDPNFLSFMERCRSWGVIIMGCSRRNGSQNENLWFPAGRKDFWTDGNSEEVEVDLGQLSFKFEGDP